MRKVQFPVSSTLQNVDSTWYQSFLYRERNRSIALLGKDNYVAWSCRVEAALVVADSWDLVSGHRVQPVILAEIRTADGTANAN